MNGCHGEETTVSGELGRSRRATGPWIAKKRVMQVVKERCEDTQRLIICCVWACVLADQLVRPRWPLLTIQSASNQHSPISIQLPDTKEHANPPPCEENMQTHPHAVPASLSHPLCSISSSSSNQPADRKSEGHTTGRGAGFPGLELLPRCTEDAFEEKLILPRKLWKLTYSHQTSWV